MILGPIAVGVFSFQVLKQNTYEKLLAVNDIHTREFVSRHIDERYKILVDNQLIDIKSYVEEYQREVISEISSNESYEGSFIIVEKKSGSVFYDEAFFNQLDASYFDSIDYGNATEFVVGSKHYVVSKYTFSPWDWIIYGIYPADSIEALLKDVATTVFLVCALAVLLLFAGTIALSHFFLIKPVDKMSRFAEKVANLKLDEKLVLEGPDEIKRLGKTLDVMKNKLSNNLKKIEKANEELAQFSYRASHDLKSPLTVTKKISEYVLKDIDSGDLDEAKINIKRMHKQICSLEALVSDILALAKADLAAENKEIVDFELIISELKEKFKLILEEANCELIINLNINEREVYGEKIRYQQIIENLISNGIKYRDKSKPNSLVRLAINYQGDFLEIEVEDNGVGIPEKNQPELFKMFKRFHPKLSSGSGLGASIIKKHVDHLGGVIVFESSNAGTTFDIKVPINVGASV